MIYMWAIFAGGFYTGGGVSDEVDIYNFTTNTWSTATLSEARVWATAAAVGDKVIIAGGMSYFPDVPSDVIDILMSPLGPGVQQACLNLGLGMRWSC